MSLSKPFHLLLPLAIAVCLSSLASAGTVRHDLVDPDYPFVIYFDDPYLALATQYPSGGALLLTIPSLPDPYLFASGTLIAPNWVLTAAHAVEESAPYPLDFYIGGNAYVVTHRITHPNFDGSPFSGYDIGLLKLQDAVTDVTPAKRYTGQDELNRIGTSVGYGATNTGDTGLVLDDEGNVVLLDGLKRAGDNMIDELGDFFGWSTNILLSDFDEPGDPTKSLMGEATPLDLEYLVASGDSGGGLFIQNEGEDLLAGVHSFVVLVDFDWQDPHLSDYGDISGHIRVSEFNSWINVTIPEPGSFIVWSLLIGLGMTVGWRRRKGAS